jgi:hypothetical protein
MKNLLSIHGNYSIHAPKLGMLLSLKWGMPCSGDPFDDHEVTDAGVVINGVTWARAM